MQIPPTKMGKETEIAVNTPAINGGII